MKYCSDCKVLNEEDALVCKMCGKPLDESTKTNSKNNRSTKTKTKHKTKVKNHGKTKVKTKTIVKDNREKGRMNFIQKFFIFILFNLCIALIGVCGYLAYHIYQNEYIDIPNVIGYTYESAETILKDKKLNAEKIETEVTDESKVGIVLKQSKKGKASENQIIKLTVGVLSTKVSVPNVKGMTLEKAIELLNKNNINYKIVYEDSDKNNIVLKQNVKENTKIDREDIVTITVSNKKETEKEVKEDKTEKEDQTEDNIEEGKEVTNEQE
ncbi:MAG: PASTA domain-containing protein [Bacilli bacterium]|nr:PASTA domain-containing protein [Bacilli bacterium]